MKCICQICSCGRHRCLHYIPSRLRKQQTQPCILTTEYSEEYMKSSPNARQTITRPSDHLRPGGEHDHKTTTHETYLPHQVKGRVLIRVKDQIETPSEEMQKDSEYKLKYKVNGRGETAHYQRNRKTQLYDSNGEPIDQSVMKNDYVPRKNWVKPVKHGPKDNLNAVATPFDSRTTNQEDFTHHKDVQKSRVIRRSDDALKSNDPFDGDTTNSATYKKWNVPRQKSGRPLSSLRPRSGKVDYHTTTDSYFQFGEKNERTKTARPKSNLGRKDGQFESDTTYSKNYLPHSMAGRAMRHKTAKWESPKVPFDSTTETTENYRAHTAQPLRFSKRQSNLRSDEAPFDSTSLYTDEYGYKKLPDCQSAKIVNSNFDGYKIYDDFNSGHRFLAKIEQTEQDINKINIGGGSAPLPPISSQDF